MGAKAVVRNIALTGNSWPEVDIAESTQRRRMRPMRSYKPNDRPAVVPRLFTEDVAGFVEFLKTAFGARGDLVLNRPTELVIDDCVLMVADGGGVREPTSSAFYIYVEDADEVWARAVKAGATSYSAPEDAPWGDRRAIVNDPWGNHWQIATHGGAKGA